MGDSRGSPNIREGPLNGLLRWLQHWVKLIVTFARCGATVRPKLIGSIMSIFIYIYNTVVTRAVDNSDGSTFWNCESIQSTPETFGVMLSPAVAERFHRLWPLKQLTSSQSLTTVMGARRPL